MDGCMDAWTDGLGLFLMKAMVLLWTSMQPHALVLGVGGQISTC